MNFLNKLEKKYRKYAIPNLMYYIVMLYGAGLAVYLLITFLVYRKRYEYARRGMKVYVAKLKRLEKRYEFQSRSKELTKEGVRHDDVSRT